jgi:hypothetical protein
VQYDFDRPRQISGTAVYWFDDTGMGECRVPESWRLFYKSGGTWLPLGRPEDFSVNRDRWNRVDFSPVETTALRVETQLQPNYSGGILEWTVK